LYDAASILLEDGCLKKLNSISNLEEVGLDVLLVLETATFQRER
jgi:hypothetical protein